MKKISRLFFLSIFLISFLSFSTVIKADENICDKDPKDLNESQLSACIDELSKSMNLSKTATRGVQEQINGIKSRVAFIENDLIIKQKNIDDGYKELTKLTEILNRTIRNFYIKSYYNSPLVAFLSASSASEITQLLAYQKAATDQDKIIITNIALSIQDLEAKKENLKTEQENLAIVKGKLDKVVAEARAYQTVLSSKIATLSARQQEILNQRQANLNIPRSAGASALYCTDDRNLDPGFSPAFAFFTYGIPHFVGLNQYGAYGRAKDGQDYKTILNAYFQNISIECRDTPGNIDVQGYGSMNFEDYIKGVVNKEMGADISEALKAQAIAARSFAMNESKPICTSQSCQVYSSDRREASNNAVDSTGANACGPGKAEFVVSDGNIVKTWFASTFGGYAHTSAEIWGGNTSYTKNFADARSPIGSFSDLNAQSYDNESKCFYTAQGWRNKYNKSAWLRSEEVADIVNTVLLLRADSSLGEHLYQTDSPPSGTDNWNEDRVKSELSKRGINPYNNISSISISADFGSGRTTSVNLSGDSGSISIDGSDFKNRFNLRVPANIQIVGRLYNVERK